ncbi:MAG: DUF2461 family protein [Planctomycetales bacterium]|nr:DUF2461 family protein [Planctomycetales bacterium]
MRRIRDYIVSHETIWNQLLKHKKFNAAFTMHNDRLKSTPRGYDKQHPLIDELRQQSFIGMAPLTRKQVQSQELVELIPRLVTAGNPLMVALCEALEQPW